MDTELTHSSEKLLYCFDGYTLDAVNKLLRGPDGQVIPLSRKALNTLLFLVRHPDEALTRQNIMAAVWPGVVVGENNLNQAIRALRKGLEENPDKPSFIMTIPGHGYRFVAQVKVRKLTESRLLGYLQKKIVMTVGFMLVVITGVLLFFPFEEI